MWCALRWVAIGALVVGASATAPATIRATSDGSPANVRAAGLPCDTVGIPTSTAYLPNITKTLGGPSGWVTPFIVQNVGASATTLEVSYYRFADGTLVTCRKLVAVAPGTSFSEVPNENADLADNTQFSVVVRSFGAQVVAVVNEQQGRGATAEALSYSGLSSGSTRLALPYVADQVAGWLTTIVIQNLGVGTASVSASFASADGGKTAALTRSVAPGRSVFVDPRFETALAVGTEYAAILTSDQPIAAIVNAHNDADGVTAPRGFSYNGAAAGSPHMYLPYVARNSDGISRTSRIVVQNTGSVDATPTLTFQKFGGAVPIAVSAPEPVKPGRSWSFDTRLAADGVSACPDAGGPACVAEGEHSLFTSGGSFAVVDITLSALTAMGYVGAAPAPSRVYLPNVTRTLGGASGWTTPIIVQSAGATSAQLRWFRFADGSLVQTQSLAGLSDGSSQRVDPRSVAGLAESTQYAVVIDAPGAVTAIVTELNFLGGDSAMAYEGFPSTLNATPVGATVTGFEGLDGFAIPDVQVAVGPSHVVEQGYESLRIFDKMGKVVSTRSTASLFPGITFTGDNALLYDLDSARFFVVGFSLTPSLLLVAVSASSDPTGPWTSWTFPSDATLDYQHIGVSRDKFAVMITAKASSGSKTNELHIFNKSDLTAGVSSPRRDVLSGSYLWPAQMLTSSDDLYLSSSDTLWTLRGTPGALNLTSVSVPGVFRSSADPSVEQPGTQPLWVGGEGRPVWANGVLWFARDTSCQPNGDTVARHCAHIWAVATGGTARLVQSFDVASAGSNTFLPSVQVDPAGNMAAIFGRSSSVEPASLYYVVQRAGDMPNTTRGPFLLKAGNGQFICHYCGDSRNRWGDYYGAALDPTDLTTMWFAGEYAKVTTAPSCPGCTASDQWGTYVVRISAE